MPTIEDIQAAVERVVVGGESAVSVVRTSNVGITCLTKYIKMHRLKKPLQRHRPGPKPLLLPTWEHEIAAWIESMYNAGTPVTRCDILRKANEMAGDTTLGVGWYVRFKDRHPTLALRRNKKSSGRPRVHAINENEDTMSSETDAGRAVICAHGAPQHYVPLKAKLTLGKAPPATNTPRRREGTGMDAPLVSSPQSNGMSCCKQACEEVQVLKSALGDKYYEALDVLADATLARTFLVVAANDRIGWLQWKLATTVTP
ncbi:Aste57867_15321 [Aphanomyces stellatus]|uniref:Aste57867_15321 protein n=1 Tax=Aphanomyces stellatus TaxID=120398 RepID=A0A485L356_9STRA|nr:hypothetical protein As57867_015265 [Aphanomyces stellatus]VFT92130.1 Aste57867_15321 [Aphanomyces stellatus]